MTQETQKQTFQKIVRYYPRVLRLVWQASPRYTLLGIVLRVGIAATAPAQIWMAKVLIDRVTATVGAASGNALDWRAVVSPLGLIFALWLFGRVSRSLSEGINYMLGFQVGHLAEYLLLEKAAQLDMAFYETPAFYDKLENAQRELGRARGLAWIGLNFIDAFIALAAVLVLLLRLNPLLVLALLVTTAPRIWVEARYSMQVWNIWTSKTSARRMVKYLARILGSRDEAKELRLFELHPPFLARHRNFWRQFVAEIGGARLARERLNVLLEVLATGGTVAVWLYAVLQAAAARITIGDLALIFQAAERAQFELTRVIYTLSEFYENSLFISTFFDFLDMPSDAVDGALRRSRDGAGGLPVPRPLQQGIEFRHVSFRYPGMERWVLRDLSFAIRPREVVALVGENGAGKTTLVKLLARLYDPTEGEILLDGRDLRDYDLADLRRQIGVIFQDFVRYELTARENIGFGQIEHVDDLPRVTRAAEDGGARPIIERLPQSFETLLGRTFDGSVDLSGGEWQKISLGRAFMREAQLLILDEPTAALDALAEYEVYRRFAELTAGKTTVFISHRFSTVRIAQHILVLKDGQLAEEGTHAALLAQKGLYAEMFNTQAERYR